MEEKIKEFCKQFRLKFVSEREFEMTVLIHQGGQKDVVTNSWRRSLEKTLDAGRGDYEQTWFDLVKTDCRTHGEELEPQLKLRLLDYKKHLAINRSYEDFDKKTKKFLSLPTTNSKNSRSWKLIWGDPYSERINSNTTLLETFTKYPDLLLIETNYILLIEKLKNQPQARLRNVLTGALRETASVGNIPATVPNSQWLVLGGGNSNNNTNANNHNHSNINDRSRMLCLPPAFSSAYENMNDQLQSKGGEIKDLYGYTKTDASKHVLSPAEYFQNTTLETHFRPSVDKLMTLHQRAAGVGIIYKQGDKDSSHEGTGFMISKVHMMTCFHVLFNAKGQEDPEDILQPLAGGFYIKFELDGEGVEFTTDDICFPANPLNQTHVGFDVAIVNLNKKRHLPIFGQENIMTLDDPEEPFRILSPLIVSEQWRQKIYLIGFNGSDCKSISLQDNSIVGLVNYEMMYTNWTLPSSSGSPGVTIDGKLLCMHRRSGEAQFSAVLPSESTYILTANESNLEGKAKAFCNAGLRIDLFAMNTVGLSENDMEEAPMESLGDEIREANDPNFVREELMQARTTVQITRAKVQVKTE